MHTANRDCHGGDCATLYTTDRQTASGGRTALVQGDRVTDEKALHDLNLPAHETVVEIPMTLIEDAAKRMFHGGELCNGG